MQLRSLIAIAPITFLLATGCATTSSVLVTSTTTSTQTHTSESSTANQNSSLLAGQAIFDKADAMIQNAQHSVLLEMYELGDSKEINLLGQKAESGVPVLVILDGSEKHSKQAISDLENHHVQVKVAAPPLIQSRGIMHAKMLVVDDSQVLIGGMNWGPGSVENADADVYTQGGTAHEAQGVFESDWRTMGVTVPSGVNDESSSAQDILTGQPLVSAIESTLDRAQTIQAVLFELSNRDIINELCKRAQAGAKVQVVLDSRMEKSINSRAANTLRKAGVEVQFYPKNQVLHEKMLIADDTVIIGSANYSYNAFTRNHELDLVTGDKNVVAQAKDDFTKIAGVQNTSMGL